MTQNCQTEGPWRAPAAARTAAWDLLADVIPDLKTLADEYRVSIDVLDEEVYGVFRGHLRQSLAGLAAALAGCDERAAREYAHSFEGTGGTMGFPEISAAGVALSRAAQAGEWQVCRVIHERLEQWLRVAEAAVQTAEGTP